MKVSDLIFELISRAKRELPEFALCGSFVSNFYRQEKQARSRFDILIRKESFEHIEQIFFFADFAFTKKFDLELDREDSRIISALSTKTFKMEMRLNFWSDEFPWAEKALKHAKEFRIDFGYGEVPVLTCEDIILSYLYDLKLSQRCSIALGDLQDIFLSSPELNLPYLAGEMKRLELSFPPMMKELLPEILYRISRRIDKVTKIIWREGISRPISYGLEKHLSSNMDPI